MRYFKHLQYKDRLKIEELFSKKYTVTEISKILKFSYSTIKRELEKGLYLKLNSDLVYVDSYSADIGEKEYQDMLKSKGPDIKISHNHKVANYIEEMILKKHLSPKVISKLLKIKFNVSLSHVTIYKYIDSELFLKISNKNLVVKKDKKQKYQKIKIFKKKENKNYIDERDTNIDIVNRKEFGHWEMDTVKGKKGNKNCLLVLTERKTRQEIITKLKDGTSDSVINALDRLERKFRKDFPKIFKTITCDNGVEFSNDVKTERSVLYKNKKRTTLYYCRPYSSWQRGSNENTNKMIRRYIPKSEPIENYDEKYILGIEDFINNYPRGIFDYKTSNELYNNELKELGIINQELYKKEK